MYIYIDGDNAPGSKTKDLGSLLPTDVLYIYYASNNNYYTKICVREALEKETKCEINWIKVPAGSNAVDFAVTIDISTLLSNGKTSEIICLISNDKHFQTIGKLLQAKTNSAIITAENSITDAVNKYRILELTSLVEVNNYFVKMFGIEYGTRLYNNMKRLFREQFHQIGKYKRKERIKNILLPINKIRAYKNNRKVA